MRSAPAAARREEDSLRLNNFRRQLIEGQLRSLNLDPGAVDGTFTLSREGRGENGGQTGDLDVTQPLTIIGNGADKTIIDGGGIDRVLHGDQAECGVDDVHQ